MNACQSSPPAGIPPDLTVWAWRCLALALLGWSGAVPALDGGKRFHDFVRDNWSIEQGLPQISALAIAQDTQGYLWVGTQAGLARFDGHRFSVYTPQSEPQLPGGWITGLLHDDHGRLWVATYKGLAVRQHDRFTSVPWPGRGDSDAPNVTDLALHGGAVLAVSENAVYRVEPDGAILLHALDRPARSLLGEGQQLWVGSLGGVYRFEGAGAPDFLALPDGAESAVVDHLLRAQGRLWLGTSQGLFHREGDRWQRFDEVAALARTPIEGMLEDSGGNLWVAENAHLSRLREGRLQERVADETAALGVRTLFEDREGNLWLGSQWNGLIRLRNGWTQRFSRREGLHTPLVWSVAEAGNGALWVGTDDGLSLFDYSRFVLKVPGSDLPHPNAYTLLVEGDTVWIGTRRGMAVWRDGALERPPRYEPLSSHQVNGILRDREGTLWLGTHGGLFRESAGRLVRIDEADGLSEPRVRALLLGLDGRLRVATHSGLFEQDADRWREVGRDQGLPGGIDITAMRELDEGRMVLGSLDERLYYFDGRRWFTLGPEQGFPPNAAFFLYHDPQYLWVAGIRGILRVPLSDLSALAAGRGDRVRGQMLLNERGDRRGGQKGYCCNGAGNAKGLVRDRQLWAPTRDGLVALGFDDVRFARVPPTTLIERLRLGATWRDATIEDDVVLPAELRDVGFEFTAISFEDPRSIGFRYRLRGYHDDWREPDEAGSRVVGYTNLPPGAYTFEVQGASIADQWSPPAQVDFSIRPHFRETGGFYAMLGGVVLLLGLAGLRWQRHRYQRRASELERLVQRRTEDLAQANQRLQEASYSDQLTGLRNRRYLAMQIPKDLAFYGRELRKPGALGQVIVFAIVDIDHFKRINDEHGHAAGDRVLQQFADLLLQQVRTGDYVARWGGEEFLVVFRPTPADHVPMLGERICRASAGFPFDIGAAQPLRVTCSLGLVEYPQYCDSKDVLSWEQLIELADRALYRVKRQGRDGWGAYRPAPGVSVADVVDVLRLDEIGTARSGVLDFIGSRAEGPGPSEAD